MCSHVHVVRRAHTQPQHLTTFRSIANGQYLGYGSITSAGQEPGSRKVTHSSGTPDKRGRLLAN